MVYRDQKDAQDARVARLEEELEEAERTLLATREELAELRRKYARARSVLAMIAHSRKVKAALEDAMTGPDELAEMMASPSNRPPPLSAEVTSRPSPRARRSSAGRYILVDPDNPT